MSRRLRSGLALAALMALGGCEHAENYRWRSEQGPPNLAAITPPEHSTFSWGGPTIAVYSYANPPPAKPDPAIASLTDRGQAALLEAINNPGKGGDKLPDLLSKPLKPEPPTIEGAATLDAKFDRTVVATITKGIDAQIGDRLVWTWIDIQPVNFNFTGYTVVATDNETLNIESISNQTTASLQGVLGRTSSRTSDAKVTPPSGATTPSLATDLAQVLGTSASLTGNLSNQYTTSATINQQYVKLSADIKPTELRIYRESERNMDVAGNTLISLSLQMDPSRWAAYQVIVHRVTKLALTDKGTFLDPDKITFSAPLEKAPPPCALKARVVLLYQLRRPTKNARSYVEGAQAADYINGRTPAAGKVEAVELVPPESVRPPSWRVYGYKGQLPLSAIDLFNQKLPLDFSSYEQARDFAIWLDRPEVRAWYAKNPDKGLVIGSDGLRLVIDDPGDQRAPFGASKFEPFANEAHRTQVCEATGTH